MEVDCCPGPTVWQRYLLGLVDDAEQDALGAHLDRCPVCEAQLGRLSDEDTMVTDLRKSLTRPAEPPDPTADLVIERVVDRSGDRTRVTGSDPPLTDPREVLNPPREGDEIGRLAHFRVLQVLGRGGMGMVFLAEDTTLRRRVALKVLNPEFARRPDAPARFLREARAAGALRHDHVVTIYQVGEADGPTGRVPFLAMELLEGVSLATALVQHPPAPGEVVRIGREVALGLAAAHRSGLIHRDIKPDNIWLDRAAGRVKLLDFGLARTVYLDSQLTQHGVIVGTPAYMAPEQAAGHSVDGRADLFSLGCVLYRMCTGRMPFPTDNVMATLTALATREPTPVREINPAVPPALAELVHRMLAKNPADRPDSAEAVADALRAVEQNRPARRAFVRRRRARMVGLAGLAVLCGVLLLRPWTGKSGGGEDGAGGADEAAPPPWAVGPGDGTGYTVAWREDFGTVPAGGCPPTWRRLNNAWAKGNGVEVGADGRRALRLIGSREDRFSAEVLVALPPHYPFTLRFRVRQGDEPLVHGVTHAIRGLVSVGPLTAAAESSYLCWAYADGRLIFRYGEVPFEPHRWREVVIRCERLGPTDEITTWVDGAFVGHGWRPAPSAPEPDFLGLVASCGSLWFGDVQLLHDPNTPEDQKVTAAWRSALKQARDQPGPGAAERLRAFAERYRTAPALRHQQLARAADALAPGAVTAPPAPKNGP